MQADYYLNCIPMQLLAGIENNFPPEYSSGFTAVQRGKLFKIGLQMKERFWERERRHGGISWTMQDITQVWYPAHGIHRDNVAAPPGAASKMSFPGSGTTARTEASGQNRPTVPRPDSSRAKTTWTGHWSSLGIRPIACPDCPGEEAAVEFSSGGSNNSP